jgi:hypothetical protein
MMSDFFEECSMVISNLGAFSNQENTLSSHQFYEQYHHRTHYYFVAHKAR